MRLSKSVVGEREAEAVRKVIVEDGYLGIGNEVKLFEQELAAYLGIDARLIATVNTGTAALTLAVDALAPKPFGSGMRGSVLVPSLTFVASYQAISAANCQAIACEVHPETGNIDLEDAGKRLQADTFAIMPVHYASNPAGLDEVYAFAQRHGLRVIEDAAHAFGCTHKGKKIGSFGDVVCFSFDGIKNITCGEGGCVIAFDPQEAHIMQDARLLSVENDTKARFLGQRTWDPDVTRQGWRFHLSNIMAAIGRVQLTRLDSEFAPARKRLAALYRELLANESQVRFLAQDPEDDIVPHIMPVRILEKAQQVQQALTAQGIPVGKHYKPNHLLSYYALEHALPLPKTEQLFSELLTLPLHPELSVEDVQNVCGVIQNALHA